MRTFSRLFVAGFLAFVLGLLAGCNVLPEPQADTARYFTLGTPPPPGTVLTGAVLRPVQLAGHLRNRAMAVRIAENEVGYLEDVRWAEALDEGIAQLLRNRLGTTGGGCVITVQVQRCEVVRPEGNQVQLAATYAIARADSADGAARRGAFTASPRTWDGQDYGALVGLIRDAVGELGDALAAALPEKK